MCIETWCGMTTLGLAARNVVARAERERAEGNSPRQSPVIGGSRTDDEALGEPIGSETRAKPGDHVVAVAGKSREETPMWATLTAGFSPDDEARDSAAQLMSSHPTPA